MNFKLLKWGALLLTILCIATLGYARDSSSVKPVNGVPVMPKAYPDTSDCKDATNIKAIFVTNNGGTGGWKQSNCPVGYVPYGFKSYVGMGLGSGEFNWHYYCCRMNVGYN